MQAIYVSNLYTVYIHISRRRLRCELRTTA